MSAIHTQRNLVCAYEPLPEDWFVETWIIGSERRFCLLTQPIAKYDEAVASAVALADKMERHIDVLPITAVEWMEKHRTQIFRMFDTMTEAEIVEMFGGVVQ